MNPIQNFYLNSIYKYILKWYLNSNIWCRSKSYIKITFKIIFLYENHTSTPLHLAVQREYIDIIKLILQNKDVNVDIEDDQGKKPIDYTTNSQIIQLFNHWFLVHKN